MADERDRERQPKEVPHRRRNGEHAVIRGGGSAVSRRQSQISPESAACPNLRHIGGSCHRENDARAMP
jgi:hypothetical protein